MQADLRYIGRDGLAVWLGLVGLLDQRLPTLRLIDVRRHDERALYGSLPGTLYANLSINYCRSCLYASTVLPVQLGNPLLQTTQWRLPEVPAMLSHVLV